MNTDQRPDEELNRIIAEWCGWKCEAKSNWYDFTNPAGVVVLASIDRTPFNIPWPNYCRDLNACHEAEKRLNREQLVDYCVFKLRYTTGEGMASDYKMICATPRQRAEAIVQVIEQQKENQ